jgi:hypothetical protein
MAEKLSLSGGAKEPSHAGEKVTIACKLPHGVELRLHRKVTVSRPVLGGGVSEVDEWYFDDSKGVVRINGNAVPFGVAPEHRIVRPQGSKIFTDGFALTPNVDKDFWEAWLDQNRDSTIVKSGLIFAQGSEAKAVDESKERIKLRSGLEPMLQKGDARAPRRIEAAEVD